MSATLMVNDVCAAAEESACLLRELYRSGKFQTMVKPDGSPVTSADLASHELLAKSLPRIENVPVVSEEDPASHKTEVSRYWLIDPLDGTRDFLGKTDEFSINIALMDGEHPVLGLLVSPVLNEVYFAEKGTGAFALQNGRPVRLPLQECRERILVKSRHHDSPQITEFAELNDIKTSLVVGSALKFNRLAAGLASVYLRFSPSWSWDVAPGLCILNESGGQVWDLTRQKPMTFPPGERRNPAFLATSTGFPASLFKTRAP